MGSIHFIFAFRNHRATLFSVHSQHTMSDISLEQWADAHNVDLRTAQGWAKLEKIPAHKVKTRVLVERSIKKYVIDETATIPQ